MGFTKKNTVSVGVSITVDSKMEAVVIDKQAKKILDYKSVPMEYNFQTKEISDYMMFANTLKTMLFEEMGLSPKNVDITLTIPSIHFAVTQLGSSTEPAAIDTALQAMAQDSYLFKRHEPVIAKKTYTGNAKDTISVVYSALQEDAAEQIRNSLIDILGVENFSIHNPNASIINALCYLGLIENQVNSNEVWNFVQITDNGFTLFSMLGTRIIEINDMPLPLKTFAAEEIYESMALSLQNNLSIYPATSLFVLSRTDLLSAQTLLQNMELRGEVAYLENNRFAQAPLMEVSETISDEVVGSISVEAIGSAITDKNSPITLCFLSNKDDEDEIYGYIPFLGREIPISETTIKYASYGVMGLIGVVAGILYFGSTFINGYYDGSISGLEKQKREIESQISAAKGQSEGNVDNIIADISKNNENTFKYFTAISAEIPPSIWLSHFYTDSAGALGIQGDTSNIDSLYGFFKNIRNSVENSDISLTKLDYNDIEALIVDSEQGNTTVSFEISNAKYSNKVSMEAAQSAAKEGEEGKDGNANGNNGGGKGGEEVVNPPKLEPLDPPTN